MSRQSRIIDFRIPARLEALLVLEEKVSAVLSELSDIPDIESVKYSYTLALHELCVNIIEHAYQGTPGDIQITLSLHFEPATIGALIVDSGIAFEPQNQVAPDLDEPHEGGYGLFLIEQLVDEVQYRRMMEKNEWQLTRVIS